MTLQELKDQGVFGPLTDKQIIQVCKDLKIPNADLAVDLNFKVGEAYIDRIKYSTVVNNYKFKEEMIDTHVKVYKEYINLAYKYIKTLEGITVDADPNKTELDISNPVTIKERFKELKSKSAKDGFDKENESLKNIINSILNEADNYKTNYENIDEKDYTKYLEQNITKQNSNNQIVKKFHNINDKIINTNSKNIKNIDESLENLYIDQNRLNNYKSKNIFIKAKLSRVSKKIERLQNKKGKIEENQHTIIKSNTTRYINKMNNRFEHFYEEFDKFENAVNTKQASIDRKKELEKETKEIENEMRNSGRIEKAILGFSKKNKQKEIERLQNKYCKVDLSEQYTYIFNHSYAR